VIVCFFDIGGIVDHHCLNLFYVILTDFNKTLSYVNDHDGDPTIPYNDYVCYALAFIPFHFTMEVNVNGLNIEFDYFICDGGPLTQKVL